jgi:regulator of replication initiation timing
VDIILEHNEKLANENTELKRRLSETEMVGLATVQKERMSRYQIEDGEYAMRKIRSEMQIKIR